MDLMMDDVLISKIVPHVNFFIANARKFITESALHCNKLKPKQFNTGYIFKNIKLLEIHDVVYFSEMLSPKNKTRKINKIEYIKFKHHNTEYTLKTKFIWKRNFCTVHVELFDVVHVFLNFNFTFVLQNNTVSYYNVLYEPNMLKFHEIIQQQGNEYLCNFQDTKSAQQRTAKYSMFKSYKVLCSTFWAQHVYHKITLQLKTNNFVKLGVYSL